MVPTRLYSAQTSRLLLTLASLVSQHVPGISSSNGGGLHTLVKRSVEHHDATFVIFACLIPFLVLLSGVFAGLTLGYMSLDETQLNVLSISGTPDQKMYANKIKPIRKDGHLLLVTLLLANMIVNETLPVISDPVLGGGVQSVVVSTVLIVIFSEIIPQSLCTRYGLYFGAKMAGPVRILIWTLGIVAWPVAKLLEFALGPHHGIIYRRAELKELIAMHSSGGEYGGDLKIDTVTIIGGALDLQEKVVKQAMTPIEDVFMLSLDAKLDYETLRKICLTGHSRVPVYEEVEVPAPTVQGSGVESATSDNMEPTTTERRSFSTQTKRPILKMIKVKKIVGILLVKQCVLLDPKDATPVRKIPLNKVPFVPNNEPLLGILDRFQTGRSHMAIVSRFSVEQAVSVKKAVKRGLTQRLRQTVGMGDSDTSSSSSSDSGSDNESVKRSPVFRRKRFRRKATKESVTSNNDTLRGDSRSHGEVEGVSGSDEDSPTKRTRFHVSKRGRKKARAADIEMGSVELEMEQERENKETKVRVGNLALPRASFGRWEQSMPADAVLTKEGADQFLQTVDPAIMPLGIITLEDVLEELIGEEIYDEFDPQGHPDLKSFAQNETEAVAGPLKRKISAPELAGNRFQALSAGVAATSRDTYKPLMATSSVKPALSALKGLNFKGLGFARSRSAPPSPTEEKPPVLLEKDDDLQAPTTKGGIHDSSYLVAKLESLAEMDVVDVIPAYSSTEGAFTRPLYEPQPRPPSPTDYGNKSALPASHSVKTRPAGITIRAPVPVTASPSPVSHIINPALILPVTSARSSSPSPSLEQAILVERKRRAVSGTSNSPAPKGTRFKSSPLIGDRNGVVVAERVKQHDADSSAVIGPHAEEEGVRIPDEREKKGPDKE